MASILYKWLIVFSSTFLATTSHPIFVSVTEINHNATNKTLEISCKIFTDDFEQTLRQQHNTTIDLLNNSMKPKMNPLVNAYIQQHLQIAADGKKLSLQFLGFEQQEEGIISYFQANNVATVKKITVTDNILYTTKPQQMQIVHVMVNGERKSSRLNNPDDQVDFVF